jgi:hypothetical protein
MGRCWRTCRSWRKEAEEATMSADRGHIAKSNLSQPDTDTQKLTYDVLPFDAPIHRHSIAFEAFERLPSPDRTNTAEAD